RVTPPAAAAMVRLYTGGAWREVPLYVRERLSVGDAFSGPAILAEADATTVVDDGWRTVVTPYRHLLMERVRPRAEAKVPGRGRHASSGPAPSRSDANTEVDPVRLEIFNNLFMSIAEQMGVRLEATAQSVNI